PSRGDAARRDLAPRSRLCRRAGLTMFTARGRLITEAFARDVLQGLHGTADPPAPVRRALESWAQRCDEVLGPASSLRAVTDVAALPLIQILGLQSRRRVDAGRCSFLHA